MLNICCSSHVKIRICTDFLAFFLKNAIHYSRILDFLYSVRLVPLTLSFNIKLYISFDMKKSIAVLFCRVLLMIFENKKGALVSKRNENFIMKYIALSRFKKINSIFLTELIRLNLISYD